MYEPFSGETHISIENYNIENYCQTLLAHLYIFWENKFRL